MGIGTILVFVWFSIQFLFIALGANLPISSSTGFENGAAEFSDSTTFKQGAGEFTAFQNSAGEGNFGVGEVPGRTNFGKFSAGEVPGRTNFGKFGAGEVSGSTAFEKGTGEFSSRTSFEKGTGQSSSAALENGTGGSPGEPGRRNSDGSDAIPNQGERGFENWLDSIQRESILGRFNDSASFPNATSYETGNADGPLRIITVAKTGIAQFQRIQDAIDSVPDNNLQRVVIYIQGGIYNEKIIVPATKPFITLQGQGKRITTVSWNDDAFTLDNTGRPIGIFKSATAAIDADNFVAADISFQNSESDPNAANKYRQAVALRISGDMAMFYNVGVLGHQDTLLDSSGRHYFYNCTIKGSVDFIFGNGKSVYKRCVLRVLTLYGSITAQARADPNEPTGFAFVNCRISGSGHPLLGRSWGDFSRVVYVRTDFTIGLEQDPWAYFGHPQRESTSFYGMYQCKGPGAEIAMKSPWTKQLTPQQAQPFIDLSFINIGKWIRPYSAVTLNPKSWTK